MVVNTKPNVDHFLADNVNDAWLTLTAIQFHSDICNPVYKG